MSGRGWGVVLGCKGSKPQPSPASATEGIWGARIPAELMSRCLVYVLQLHCEKPLGLCGLVLT